MSSPAVDHWQAIYRDKSEAQTSWFRPHLDASLQLIDDLRLPAKTPLIDIGSGRSTLVDDLLARGFTDITALDVAAPALDDARARLGADCARVHWLVADVTAAKLPARHFGLWHDRAVFHFFTEPESRQRYIAGAAHAVRAGGHAVIATFAPDGPERCSGLPVCRYDAATLAGLFWPAFEPVGEKRDVHLTPAGLEQAFTYVVLCRRRGVE